MQSLRADSWIGLDHTFKTASNIGYRRSDGKWVTLYNSVFFVTNEIGQVISWQLTKSTSIDEVNTLLDKLKARLNLSKQLLVIVDNCCSQRTIVVKLDLFHAVQRLTKFMPKRHPYFLQCMNDLKLIFRHPTDLGASRTKPTPEPDEIVTNLKLFTDKWKKCVSGDWGLINANVMKEVSSLTLHINKHCLSDIPPRAGTNRNEALHRVLNSHFSRLSKIGLPLALALLTTILYQHNCKISEKVTGIKSGPVSLLGSAHQPTDEHFGVIPKESASHDIVHWLASPVDTTSPIDFNCIDVSEEALELVSMDEITQMVENVTHLTQFADCLRQFTSKSPLFNAKFLPFMSSVNSIFFSESPSPVRKEQELEHKQRLNVVLTAWGLQLNPVAGDGNCCFRAVACSLIMNEKAITSLKADFFNITGGAMSSDSVGLSKTLRELAVKEWKENVMYYEGFIEGSVAEEAEKFLQDGVFSGPLGDTMVLALSNALSIPITIFSSIRGHPLLNFLPRHVSVQFPLFLAYTQYGPGHYDAIVTTSLPTLAPEQERATATKCCTCGKNDKTEATHCHPKVKKYTTVCNCPCFKDSRACSDYCKCKFCKNPHGAHDRSQVRRKRPRQAWQQCIPNSYSFATALGEDIERGPRSLMEFFALEQALSHCLQNGIQDTAENVSLVYHTLAEVASGFEKTLPFGRLSLERVSKFHREHQHNLKLFESICIAELHIANDPQINCVTVTSLE